MQPQGLPQSSLQMACGRDTERQNWQRSRTNTNHLQSSDILLHFSFAGFHHIAPLILTCSFLVEVQENGGKLCICPAVWIRKRTKDLGVCKFRIQWLLLSHMKNSRSLALPCSWSKHSPKPRAYESCIWDFGCVLRNSDVPQNPALP